MTRVFFYLVLVFTSIYTCADELTDQQIKQLIIQNSIQSYPASCPCPYNSARNGSSCGKRSAWTRAGGYAPYCYPSDISEEMVSEYKAKFKVTKN
ncbi:hypothetical protein [Spartinivicinus ruber]|uniref:hypothetical protein n=1 Tax=Spartinivicinus ruber TaxID=2683272 RepID=UPI001E301A0F|nr:hypothetical protein [Spartinivicinus ruber]